MLCCTFRVGLNEENLKYILCLRLSFLKITGTCDELTCKFVSLAHSYSTWTQCYKKLSFCFSHPNPKNWMRALSWHRPPHWNYSTCTITIVWIHHKTSGNECSGLCHELLQGALFRHNECLRDRTSCKVNVGEKNEVHLTSIYSHLLQKIAFTLVLPLDIFFPITKSHKDPPSVLCGCATSALDCA